MKHTSPGRARAAVRHPLCRLLSERLGAVALVAVPLVNLGRIATDED